jgi:Spy/CpxP family protein refolding chaperone
MRPVLFPLLALLSLASFLFAQDAPEAKPGERFQKMAAELKLTDDQKEQLRPVFEEQAKKLMELRDDTSLDRRSRLMKARDLQQGFQAKVNPILTEEQRKKWSQMQQENREELKKRRGGRQ